MSLVKINVNQEPFKKLMLITDVVIFTSAFANGVVVFGKIARNNFVCYDVTQFLLRKINS